MSELLNRQDLDFLLYQCFDSASVLKRKRYQEHSLDTINAAIDVAEKLAKTYFADHNHAIDSEEPSFDGQKVTMLPAVQKAVKAFAEAGFIAGSADFDDGGMQLPEVFMAVCLGLFTAANPSTTGYPFLTAAALKVIENFADAALIQRFVPSMRTGRFLGTMALTEPHAGSSLADITTSATLNPQGDYLIKGNKLYISGGDHELSENIVHLVLAKIKGAPAGVKGISLFIVPKFLLNDDGSVGDRNDVQLAGLIHKLGYRGTTSTALTFGENNACVGYLVGEPHQGLRYMFQMMNEARLGVGFGAAVIGYRGYLHALDYAKERLQGRSPIQNDPSLPPIAIIEHTDVKRMLLAQKCYAEGAMALCLYGASLVEDSKTHPDAERRQTAEWLLDLLTPVLKSWPSEYGVKANDLAIQVLGGAGYTREYPVEQCWRDNRLNPIHEGTHGIQALDLLGRKIWQHNSQGLILLSAKIKEEISTSVTQNQYLALSLAKVLDKTAQVTHHLAQAIEKDGPELPLGLAHCYLKLFGHLVVGWLWLKQSNIAYMAQAADGESDFYQGKIQAAKYFFHWELPETELFANLLLDGDNTCQTMQAAWF